MLFMQPCEAAQVSKARNTTSVIRWLVRTFPPTTAAVSEGSNIEPSGMITLTGFRQPYNVEEEDIGIIYANNYISRGQYLLYCRVSTNNDILINKWGGREVTITQSRCFAVKKLSVASWSGSFHSSRDPSMFSYLSVATWSGAIHDFLLSTDRIIYHLFLVEWDIMANHASEAIRTCLLHYLVEWDIVANHASEAIRTCLLHYLIEWDIMANHASEAIRTCLLHYLVEWDIMANHASEAIY